MNSYIYNLLFSSQLLMTIISLANCEEPLQGIEMFSLGKLVEYNSLIECFTTIKEDFSACNREAHHRGEVVLKYVDENSDFGVLLKCCGTWLVRDCWVDAAKDKCKEGSIKQLYNLPAKFMPAISQMCKDYQPGSFYCYVPHIIGISLFVFAVLIIGAAIAIVIIIYRRRIRMKRVEVESEHSNNNEDKLKEKLNEV
jgi:hypothetical protein